jgi:ectoine hydroxylase-related dioxygenase (phytanoyl-CoA dioxygenase family)
MKLNEDQISQFHRDGYILVEGLLSESEVEALRQRVEDIATGTKDFPEERLEYEPGAEKNERRMESLRKINQGAGCDEVLSAHSRHPAILDVIESLLGPDIKRFGDQLFVKPPGGVEKPYHQDSPYFKIEPMALVSSWVALDDVTLENGCLYFVPGSHVDGALAHSEDWEVGDRRDMKIPDSAIELAKETPITMKAGDVSFHHSLLLHRSGPNKTQQFRRGYATHYMSCRSRWTGEPDKKPDYLLLRGAEYEGCV